MDRKRLQELAGINLTENYSTTANFDGMLSDIKRYLKKDGKVTVKIKTNKKQNGDTMKDVISYAFNDNKLNESDGFDDADKRADIIDAASVQMADIFEKAMKQMKIEEVTDEFTEVSNALADALHEELRERGVYG